MVGYNPAPDHVERWRVLQVASSAHKRLRVVPKVPQNFSVARFAQKPPDETCFVVVVYSQFSSLPGGAFANETFSPLRLVDALVFLRGDPVGFENVLPVVVFARLFGFGPVVRGAPWTGVFCLSAGGYTLRFAVFAAFSFSHALPRCPGHRWR